MRPLLATQTATKMNLKTQEVNVKSSPKGDASGAPKPGVPTTVTGHSPRIPFRTDLTIDLPRFELYFSCSVWVLRRDSISGHVWYSLRTNICYHSSSSDWANCVNFRVLGEGRFWMEAGTTRRSPPYRIKCVNFGHFLGGILKTKPDFTPAPTPILVPLTFRVLLWLVREPPEEARYF